MDCTPTPTPAQTNRILHYLWAPYHPDARFNENIRAWDHEYRRNMIELLQHPERMRHIQWAGEYGSLMIPTKEHPLGIEYDFKCADPMPVPAHGFFCNMWEPDHETYCGVTRDQWDHMTLAQHRQVESQLQAKKYVANEYRDNWIEFYASKSYDHFYWDVMPRVCKDFPDSYWYCPAYQATMKRLYDEGRARFKIPDLNMRAP
jgi:hypothetical protein